MYKTVLYITCALRTLYKTRFIRFRRHTLYKIRFCIILCATDQNTIPLTLLSHLLQHICGKYLPSYSSCYRSPVPTRPTLHTRSFEPCYLTIFSEIWFDLLFTPTAYPPRPKFDVRQSSELSTILCSTRSINISAANNRNTLRESEERKILHYLSSQQESGHRLLKLRTNMMRNTAVQSKRKVRLSSAVVATYAVGAVAIIYYGSNKVCSRLKWRASRHQLSKQT